MVMTVLSNFLSQQFAACVDDDIVVAAMAVVASNGLSSSIINTSQLMSPEDSHQVL